MDIVASTDRAAMASTTRSSFTILDPSRVVTPAVQGNANEGVRQTGTFPIMRRLAPLVLAVALVPAATAWADEQIQASPFNSYDNPNVTIDQGERLTFRNTDVNS